MAGTTTETTTEAKKAGKADLKQYYVSGDPEISDDCKAIMTQYSGVSDDDLVPHIRTVRDRAWKLFHYPCIGSYGFLNFSISRTPQYADVLTRIKAGQTLLDLACCFGQDIRKLVFDGAPAQHVAGTELEQGFIDMGYELFRDRTKLQTKFTAGDFFEAGPAGVEEQSFDFVHAAAFFHLFSWNEQVEAMSKAMRLLKPKSGSMLFGRQTGMNEAGVMRHPATRSGEMYRHNDDSLRRIIAEVRERTRMDFDVDVSIDDRRGAKAGQHWRVLNFSLTLK